MSKKNNKNKNNKKAKTAAPAVARMKQRIIARPGPVATINTAPVAIGNSLRGMSPVVTRTKDGVRVVGRDFIFTASSTVAAATSWEVIGGMPLTPSVLPSSVLRNYAQMYAKFKVNRAAVHYITSSPTSQAGDILFYYERDRKGPFVDYTNNSFLPYVLSDGNTVIGPQWTNHTLIIKPTDGFNFTDYAMNADLNEDACGSVFLFSKTNSANSPGYMLMDYDITFKELCVNPRAGLLPVARGQWNQICLGKTATAVTSGVTNFQPSIQGNNVGGSAAALPSLTTTGDIFKIIFQVTNSTVSGVNSAWTNCNTTNLIVYNTAGSTSAVTIDDGFTCYGMYSNNVFNIYPTLEQAIVDTHMFLYGTTATVTYNLCAMISLVYINNGNQQNSY